MERLWDLERAKVLAIFLVVFGHIFGRAPPPGGEWWYLPESYIYLFHMPLFMFLSGFVFCMKGYHRIPLGTYRSYFASRAERLLLPFIVMGLIIVCGKVFASQVLGLPIADHGLIDGLLGIFEITESPVRFIWYLYTVFLFSIATPIFCGYLRIPLGVLALFALVLFFLPLPDVLYLSYIRKFYVFFLVGGMIGLRAAWFQAFLDRYATTIFAAFLAATLVFFVTFWNLRTFFAESFWVLGMSAVAIPAVLAFTRTAWARRQDWWTGLSAFVFSIYLFNVPIIGVTKEVFKRVIPYTSDTMLVYMPILVAAGFIGPIVLRRVIFERSSYLKKMTA